MSNADSEKALASGRRKKKMIRRYTPLIKEIWWYISKKQIVRFPSNSRTIADPLKWAATRRNVLARDNYTCRECGKRRQSEQLDVHHIKPHWRGGSDTEANLITLCYDCHEKHHASDQETKAEAQRRSTEARKIPHLVRCECGCKKLFIGKSNTRYKAGHRKANVRNRA